MKIELPPLPYAVDALEPHVSANTVSIHYEKHQRGYLEKLLAQLERAPNGGESLGELVLQPARATYNNAAQVWNHTFYWRSLRPSREASEPRGRLLERIDASFGSQSALKQQLADAAHHHFASGWVWLVEDREGRLAVTTTHDAENPLLHGQRPLLGIDVWEHAYYLDVQSERERYVEAVLDHLLNWEFASENLRARGAA